jgi:molybdopterin-guanine dinucleotide biosynthesis protein A
MSDAFHRLDVCVVEDQELRSADPGLDSFVNVNRPEALAAIERRLADAPEPGASVR